MNIHVQIPSIHWNSYTCMQTNEIEVSKRVCDIQLKIDIL